MQNQRLKKIDIAKSGFPRSRFNFSHDVNTTCEFGVIQPAMCKMIVPNSKTTLGTESLTRLAPMVVPTFGRVKYKLWHQFVELPDICEQFDAMMTQQPLYSPVDKSTFVPEFIPRINLSALCSFVFVGARATMWLKVTNNDNDYPFKWQSFKSNVAADVASLEYIVEQGKNAPSAGSPIACPIADKTGNDSFFNTSVKHVVLQLKNRVGQRNGLTGDYGWDYDDNSALDCPLGNMYNTASGAHWIDLGFRYNSNGVLVNSPVSMEGADFIYQFDFYDSSDNKQTACIAFRFSDFGKRLRKILIGLGYQIDIGGYYQVSLLPLFAYYKAYWNLFGLTQWQDWQQTNCYKCIRELNSAYTQVHQMCCQNAGTFGYYHPNFKSLFVAFIKDLADCFVTESTDFVSAHLQNVVQSPVIAPQFVDVGLGNPTTRMTLNDSAGSVDGTPNTTDGHSFINNVSHTYYDEEYLKRLAKWSNRNSVIGRRIVEIAKAQGLGDPYDEVKTDFIGYTEDVVQISDVVSTADTFQNGSGASLGEFGGKGVQYTKSKNFTYENDVFGYWVTLCAIVPESGYSQQIDSVNLAIKKTDFYHPEFDSLGMNLSRKAVVQGASDWFRGAGGNALGSSFGFKPVYFEYKFAQNVNNGDFTRRGSRDVYLPYFLDKFIPVNDQKFKAGSSEVVCYGVNAMDGLQLPVATDNVWRFPTKFKWLGNLDRMFINNNSIDQNGLSYDYGDKDWFYFVWSTVDNFLVHNIFDMQCFAPMLAVEDSFDTREPDEKADMSISKA